MLVDGVYQRSWSKQIFIEDGINTCDMWRLVDVLKGLEDKYVVDLSILCFKKSRIQMICREGHRTIYCRSLKMESFYQDNLILMEIHSLEVK